MVKMYRGEESAEGTHYGSDARGRRGVAATTAAAAGVYDEGGREEVEPRLEGMGGRRGWWRKVG